MKSLIIVLVWRLGTFVSASGNSSFVSGSPQLFEAPAPRRKTRRTFIGQASQSRCGPTVAMIQPHVLLLPDFQQERRDRDSRVYDKTSVSNLQLTAPAAAVTCSIKTSQFGDATYNLPQIAERPAQRL